MAVLWTDWGISRFRKRRRREGSPRMISRSAAVKRDRVELAHHIGNSDRRTPLTRITRRSVRLRLTSNTHLATILAQNLYRGRREFLPPPDQLHILAGAWRATRREQVTASRRVLFPWALPPTSTLMPARAQG